MCLGHELFPARFLITALPAKLSGMEKRRHRHFESGALSPPIRQIPHARQYCWDQAYRVWVRQSNICGLKSGLAIMLQRLPVGFKRLGVFLALLQQCRQLRNGHDVLRRQLENFSARGNRLRIIASLDVIVRRIGFDSARPQKLRFNLMVRSPRVISASSSLGSWRRIS